MCVAADVSASMLNVAAEAARKAGLTNVETRVMNAENLELDADSFDAVICRIALMLFPNPAKALNRDAPRCEAWRQSRSDGLRRLGEKSLSWRFFMRQFAAWETYHWPAPGEPWMFALGEPGALEEVYRRGRFSECVGSRCSDTATGLPSAAAAVENMRKGAGDRKGDYEPVERG